MAFTLNKKSIKSTWSINHVVGDETTIILLDEILDSNNPTDSEILKYLESILSNTGILSYIITSSINIKNPKPFDKDQIAKESKSLGKLGFQNKYNSGWYSAIVEDCRKRNIKVNTIIAFGASFYQCIQSSEDITVYDLYFPYLRNYIYQGHGFEGDLGMFKHQFVKDMFIFPMFTLTEMFIPESIDNPYSTNIELGFWKLNFMVEIFNKVAKKDYRLPDNMDPCILVDLDSKEKILSFLDHHMGEENLAIDTETSGFDFMLDFIRCVQVAFDETTGYYMEWKDVSDPKVFPKFCEFLLSCKNVITQNGKFDIKFLWKNGVPQEFQVTEDAMEMAHILCSDRKKGLKTQSYMYTPYGGYDNQLDNWLASQKKLRGGIDVPYSDAPKSILFPYATMDPIQTMRNYNATLKDINEFAINHPTTKPKQYTGGRVYTPYIWYKEYVMPLYQCICKTEYNGMYLNEDVMNKHRKDLMDMENKLRDEIVTIFKDNYNLDIPKDYEFSSTVKLGKLFEQAGWDCHGLDKSGKLFATAEEQFSEWIKRDNKPGAKEIQTLRQIKNGYGTYIGIEEKSVDKKTGKIKSDKTGWLRYARRHIDDSVRLHTSFGCCLNSTFRCRSSEPNFQNLPTRGEIAPLIKQCLSVPPSNTYHFTLPNGHKYTASETSLIHVRNHPSGKNYVEARFLKGLENTNCEIDETEPVVVIYGDQI